MNKQMNEQMNDKWTEFEAAAYQHGMSQQETAEKWTWLRQAIEKICEILKPIVKAFMERIKAMAEWFQEIRKNVPDPVKKKHHYNWQVPADTRRKSQVLQPRPAYAMRKGIHR